MFTDQQLKWNLRKGKQVIMQLVCPYSYLWFRKVDGKVENMKAGALRPTEPALGHVCSWAGWPHAKHLISPSLQ